METNEPEFYVRSEASQQQVEQIRPKKKVAINKRDMEVLKA